MRIQKRGSHARTASSHGTATLYLAFINKPISRSLSLSIFLVRSLFLPVPLSFCPVIFLSLSLSLMHTPYTLFSVFFSLPLCLSPAQSLFLSFSARITRTSDSTRRRCALQFRLPATESINTRFQSLVCFPLPLPPPPSLLPSLPPPPSNVSPLYRNSLSQPVRSYCCTYQFQAVIQATKIT